MIHWKMSPFDKEQDLGVRRMRMGRSMDSGVAEGLDPVNPAAPEASGSNQSG
jgi:hypothetical protein